MLKIKLFNLLFCIAVYSVLSASEIQVLDYTTLDCQEVRSFISQSWNLCKLTGFAQYQLGYSYVCEGKHPLHSKPIDEKRFISDIHPDVTTVSVKDSNQFLKSNPSKRQSSLESYPIYTSCCQQGRNQSETECNVIDIMVGCSDEINFEYTSAGACEMTNEIKSIEN